MAASQPVYQAVYQRLRQDITEGRYAVGDHLPSEAQLQAIHGVSRATVRRALELLASESLIATRQGRSAVVISQNIRQNYNRMNSFTETLRGMGYHVSLKKLAITRTQADAETAKALQVDVGHELVCIHRIPQADGRPAAIMTNYIPAELVPEIERYEGEILALYSFLKQRYRLNIDAARDIITAHTASFEQSCILCCAPGAPMVYTRRVCLSGGKPVCYDRLFALAQLGGAPGESAIPYEIEITLTARPSEED